MSDQSSPASYVIGIEWGPGLVYPIKDSLTDEEVRRFYTQEAAVSQYNSLKSNFNSLKLYKLEEVIYEQ